MQRFKPIYRARHTTLCRELPLPSYILRRLFPWVFVNDITSLDFILWDFFFPVLSTMLCIWLFKQSSSWVVQSSIFPAFITDNNRPSEEWKGTVFHHTPHYTVCINLDVICCNFRYLKEFRVEQCPLFLQHKCQQHRPFTCFNWHFQNQKRRRPLLRRDQQFNYSADIYCEKYDETTGLCPVGDE